VTATKSWPKLPSIRRKQRSLIRWQHLLKREHPTSTERKSLTKECGWKGGDRGGLAQRQRPNQKTLTGKEKTDLTLTGLLMEGLGAIPRWLETR
jgi:hypothetical protein